MPSKCTVSGTVFDAAGNLATSGTVVFSLQPFSPSVLYFVSGVGELAPASATAYIDSAGHLKLADLVTPFALWGVDNITPGNLTYQADFYPNGSFTNSVPQLLITGASYDLSAPVFGPTLQINPESVVVITTPIQQNIIPGVDAVFNLGSPLLRYANIYAVNGSFTNFNFTTLSVSGLLTVGSLTTGAINGTAPVMISTVGDVMANIITAMINNPGGAELIVPAGTFTCAATAYNVPNDGTAFPQQASFRIRGVSADPGSTNITSLGKVPSTGTIIKFTGSVPGSGGRVNFLGMGQVEITGVTFQETVGAPTLFTTNTILKVHDCYFYGEVFAWISNGVATRIQTTGGTLTGKYTISLGAGSNGVNYRYFVFVKNQGATTVTVSNGQGTNVSIPAGTIKEVQFLQVSNGSTLTLTFSTANSGDNMDVIAQYPIVAGHGGFDANLITGASLTFAGSWAAVSGSVPTLTQNQTVNQRPVTDAIILGGGNNTGGGTTSDSFQGYLTTIRENFFNQIRSAVVFKLNANKVQVTGNHIWPGSGSDLQGCIDFSGGCNGNDISWNNIESFFYKFPIWSHGSAATGNSFINNSFYDIQAGGPFISGYSFEAGSAGNLVISSNGEGLTGISQLVTDGTIGQTTILSTINPPACVRIADTLLGGSAGNITFSNIPGNYKALKMEIQARTDTVATNATILLQFNGDAGANYDGQNITANNANPTGASFVAAVNGVAGVVLAANATRGAAAGVITITIPNYASTTFEKSYHAESGCIDSASANNFTRLDTVNWRNTAAINSIKLFPSGGANFVAGTRATLYGLT